MNTREFEFIISLLLIGLRIIVPYLIAIRQELERSMMREMRETAMLQQLRLL